jgi:hypothetical protein
MPYPDSEYPSILRGKDKRESQRLMAAAPDMLAALQAILGCAHANVGGMKAYFVSDGRMAAAAAAVAKAEGRE